MKQTVCSVDLIGFSALTEVHGRVRGADLVRRRRDGAASKINPEGPTRQHRDSKIQSLAAVFVSVALAGSLFVGCAARRDYPGPIHGLTLDGTVLSIDVQTRHLTVAPRKPAAPVVVEWEASTKMWKNGIPIQPTDVEQGQSTRIHYHIEDGHVVAHHVYINVLWAPQY
jgi:hypothetical protein